MRGIRRWSPSGERSTDPWGHHFSSHRTERLKCGSNSARLKAEHSPHEAAGMHHTQRWSGDTPPRVIRRGRDKEPPGTVGTLRASPTIISASHHAISKAAGRYRPKPAGTGGTAPVPGHTQNSRTNLLMGGWTGEMTPHAVGIQQEALLGALRQRRRFESVPPLPFIR